MGKNSSVKNDLKKEKFVVAPWTNGLASDTEIKQRRDRATEFEEIGINIYSVDREGEHENPYRAEAVMLITQGKPVPNELKGKIKEYDMQHKQ